MLSKSTAGAGNNVMSLGNFYHCIHNSNSESCNSVLGTTIGVPLIYASDVEVHWIEIWGAGGLNVRCDIIVKTLIYPFLGCSGFIA